MVGIGKSYLCFLPVQFSVEEGARLLQLVFAGVAEGVVPASLSCIQLLLSEARPGILEPFLASV